MITLKQAKELQIGDILIDEYGKRWKVNGAVQSWKRDATRIRVPLKHGLYAYDAITEVDFQRNDIKPSDLRYDFTELYTCRFLTKEGK